MPSLKLDSRGTWVPSTRDEYLRLFDDYGGSDSGRVEERGSRTRATLTLHTDVLGEDLPGGPMPLAANIGPEFFLFRPNDETVQSMLCESIAGGVVCMEPAAAWNGRPVCEWHGVFEKVIYRRGA